MKQFVCMVFVLVSAAIINNVKSQQLAWQKTYGGTSLDHGMKCVSTSDGGFIFGGTSESTDLDITAPYGNMDLWIVKTTASGLIEWQQSLGGTLNDEFASILQTSDGGYLIVGTTESEGGLVFNNHGNKDIWVVKMFSTGYIDWRKCYGGTGNDIAFDVIENSGHYVIVGETNSYDGDASTNTHSNGDGWIFQINNTNGAIEWNKFYGGSNLDYFYTIDLTSTGGFIVGGNTMSNDGDVIGSNGNFDAWILNLDATGNVIWKNNFGGVNDDYVRSIKEDSYGNFIFGGYTNSSNSGNIGTGLGLNDFWFTKLYNNGNVAFSRNYGGTDADLIQSVDEVTNGYVLLGYTYSNDNDITTNYGAFDAFLIKTDISGNITWKNNYGGSSIDHANNLIVLNDGEFIIAGETYSSDHDIDISGFNGACDYWLLKLTNFTANITSQDVSCYGGNNGWAAANPSGGTAPYYYNWSTTPPQTTDTIYNLIAGTYYVTITDINNNSAVDSVVISQPEQLNAIVVTIDPSCVGVNDGSVQIINPTGGGGFYQFSINGTTWYGAMTFNNLSAESVYTVLMRDLQDISCVVHLQDSLVLNPQLEIGVNLYPSNTIICNSSQIAISTSVSYGASPYIYEWNVLNNTSPNLNVASGGIYSLRVKDNNGCIGFSKVEIDDVSPENILNNIDLTSGLIAYYPFNNDASDQSGNNYNGTVNGPFLTYDRFGYYNSAYYFDGVDDYISLPAFSGNDTTIGDFTASAWIYMYSQNPNNQSNNFRSTILDMRGDSTSGGKSFTFTLDSISGEPTEIHHVISWPSGGNIIYKDDMPSSPIGNWSFLTLKREGNMLNTYLDGVLQANEFSTGSTLKTDSLFLNCKGRIGATANDFNRCFNGIIDDIRIYNRALSVDEILALYHEQRELAIVSNNYVCDGTSITLYLNNAQPNIKYSVKVNSTIRNFTQVWNGLNLRFTINSDSLNAGENNLQFTATDTILNCSITLDTILILTKHVVSVNINSTNSIICGPESIQLDANVIGGTSPFAYNWNILNASSTSAIVNSPGIYSARVTDGLGCKGFATKEIYNASPDDLLNNVDLTSGIIAHYPLDNNSNDVSGNSYNGTVNGAITATDRFGNANSAYKFDGYNDYISLPSFENNAIVDDFTVSAWVYMDAHNVNVTNNRYRSSILDMRGDSISTGKSFALTIDSIADDSPSLHHTISWPTGGTTVYTDNITSPIGHWEFITLRRQGNNLNSFLNGALRANEFTFGSPDPKIDPLFLNNKGRIGSPANNSSAWYFNGKIDDVRIYGRALTNNEILALYMEGSIINISLQDNELCAGANTNLTIYNSQQNIKYQLTASGTPYGNPQIGNGGTLTFNIQSAALNPGINYVQISATDTIGLNCSIILDTTLAISVSSLSLNMTAVNVTCNGGNNGQATVSPSGGISPYTYLWNSIPPKTTPTINGLTPGFYTVTVTDNIGCTANATVTITQPSALSLNISTQDATCGQNNGSATVSVTGGTTPYTYQWNNGVTTPTADSLVGGFYFVTVTDSKACSKFKMASINESGGPNILLNSISHVNCYNASTGSIDISVNNGTAPYEYEWSNGSLNQDLNGVLAGTYEVIVKDYNNCQSISSYTIYQPNDINIITSTENSGCGVSNGTATAYVNGGTAPYTYTWNSNPVQNTQTATGLASGSYSLTITDNNGCIKVKNTGIVVNSTNGPVLVTDSIIGTTCGSNDGAVYVTASGGTPPFQTIIWSNGNTSEDLSGVTNGVYSLTITDNNGCEGTISEEVPAIVPLDQQICIVSVDSATNKNLVAWEKVQTTGIDYYKVFREGNQAGVYNLIGTIPFDSISIFVDTTSKPKVRAYRYKISAVDLCGNESQLSTEHKTMHLTINVGLNGTVNLIWDHYEGINFSSYLIYRYMQSTGWVMIDSMPNNLTSYTDYPSTTAGIAYKIAVDAPFICDPAGLLNKTQTGPYSQSISNIDDYGIYVGSNLIFTDNNISVFPNPFENDFDIKFQNNSNDLVKIEIFDLTGKVVYMMETKSNNLKLSRGSLNSGVYILKLTGKAVFYEKLIAK